MNIRRREFLKRWLGWMGIGGWMLWIGPARAGARKGPEWFRVGVVTDFKIGQPTLIEKGRPPEGDVPVHISPVYVIRNESGVRAMSAECTHAGCTVDLDSEGGFVCPCHGSQFDAQGAPVKGPARSALPEIPVRIENGEVWVFTQT